MSTETPAAIPAAPAAVGGPRHNPFVGPRALETGELLFGRDDEVVDLLNQLIADRVVLMYSVSGAGKTSLLKAGLIPGLESRGFTPLPVAQVRDERPAGLTGNRYRLSVLQRLEAGRPAAERLPVAVLDRLTLADYLKDRAAGGTGGRVLILDQFEDVLRIDPTDVEIKDEFFADFGAALRDTGLWAVISMREDHVAGLDPYLRHLPTRLRSRFRLALLTESAAREAVSGPAEAAGVPFHPDAAAQLVDQLRQVRVMQLDGTVEKKPGPYVEPVQLQVVCQLIWDRLPAGATAITPAMLAGFSVDQALEQYYAVKVRAAAQAGRVSERRVRRWVEDKLITESGLRGQVLQGHPDTAGLCNVAIRSLVDAYLVRSEPRLGGTWYELTHDRLVDPIRRSNRAWRRQQLKRRMLYALPAGMVTGLLTFSLMAYYGLDKIGTLETELKTQKTTLQTEIQELQERKVALTEQSETLTKQAEELKKTNAVLTTLTEEAGEKNATPEVKGQKYRPNVGKAPADVRWARGESIRVGFLDGDANDRNRVEHHAQGWTRFANVTFDFDTRPEQADVRVSFSQRGASYSLLGREALQAPRTEATTQLGAVVGAPEAEVRRLTLHEFGHVLGLMHEYQNPNSNIRWNVPAVLAYYRRSMPPETTDQQILAQFQALSPSSPRNLFGNKPFDPKSVMMFQIPRSVVESGWTSDWEGPHNVLSEGDKKSIVRLYPFEGAPAVLPVDGLEPGEHTRTVRVRRLKLDRYQFRAAKPGRYVVEARYANPGLEVYLLGPGDEATDVKANDPARPDSRVEADLRPGTYFVQVRHQKPTKAETYTIRVRYEGAAPK